MMRTGRLVMLGVLCTILMLLDTSPSVGQDDVSGHEDEAPRHTSEETGYHPNHFGGFLGVSTRLEDTNSSAFTLGLEYARLFSPRWAVVGYVELSSSDIERDVILAAGAIFYPMPRLGLVVGPGIEVATKDTEHQGTTEREDETEFLVRFGAGYGFHVTSQTALGPVLLADWAGNRWTLVYGLGIVVGF